MFKLLTRDEFREGVFKRDGHLCVVCKNKAVDAHHLIERRLFKDGGCYIENGASVCQEHHLAAESTVLSCDELRKLAGITKFPTPEHLYPEQPYDKWGNPILSNGMRLKGELFHDQSVQKIISPVLHLFVDKIKYPRTFHLPWSPGVTNDDKILESLDGFNNKEVVVTIKLDGENTNLYRDYLHARSIEYNPHPSRSWIKSLHAKIAHEIPEGWRVCGENLYAKHSIKYNNLDDYFLVFSIWNEKNVCLSWDETKEWAELFGLKIVPELYRGPFDENKIKSLYTPIFNGDDCEGYVVRICDSFHYKEFRKVAGKFVRKNHVVTHDHWIHSTVEPNQIKGH